MHYEWDFGFLWQYRGLIGIGIAYTAGFPLLTSVLGLVVGAAIALGRIAGRPWMAAPLSLVTFVAVGDSAQPASKTQPNTAAADTKRIMGPREGMLSSISSSA